MRNVRIKRVELLDSQPYLIYLPLPYTLDNLIKTCMERKIPAGDYEILGYKQLLNFAGWPDSRFTISYPLKKSEPIVNYRDEMIDAQADLTGAIRRIEEAFVKKGLTFAPITKIELPEGGSLIWGVQRGVWRLYLSSNDGTDWKPLEEASFDLRVSATHFIPELYRTLANRAVAEIAAMKEATQTVHGLLDSLLPEEPE